MRRVFFALAALGLALGYAACERHDWQETRALHLKHEGGHHESESAEPAAGH